MRIIVAAALGAVLAASAAAQEKKADERFEKLKKLAGEWTDDKGKVTARYAVTASGSAVTETLFPGESYEMLTVFTMDGKDLVLTHYCALGNQPRMKAAEKLDGNKLAFTCAGVGNTASHDELHMHSAVVEFTDDDNIVWTWSSFEKGKELEKKVVGKKTRKK
jgi:hypothetical protein